MPRPRAYSVSYYEDNRGAASFRFFEKSGEQFCQLSQREGLELLLLFNKADHLTTRWENLPLSSHSALETDQVPTIITGTAKDEPDKKPKTFCQKVSQFAKLLVPHVILIMVLLGYLSLSATMLMQLETHSELVARSQKLIRLSQLFENLSQDSWQLISDKKSVIQSEQAWTDRFTEYLTKVAEQIDDRRPIRKELEEPGKLANIESRWTYPTALLYVLTVLTTCGYGEVSVNTDLGKIFSVAFALVGIPLMFITAADIGIFLSDILLKSVEKWERLIRQAKKVFKGEQSRDALLMHKKTSLPPASELVDLNESSENKLWFPIGAYVGCICLYCSLGSAMFINWEHQWSFIHAFHFGFNLIVTVGLGDLIVRDYMFLALIIAFVIIGLSVVTMCVDLASTHLKAYFTRIHYFGRAKRFLGMREELKDIVGLLAALRKKKGGKVTWNDVRDFLDNEMLCRPFEPLDLLLKMRFIDDTSSGVSTVRHDSYTSEHTAFRELVGSGRKSSTRPTSMVITDMAYL